AAPNLVEAADDLRLDDGHARGLCRSLRTGEVGPRAAGHRPGLPPRGSAGRPRTHGARRPVRQDRPADLTASPSGATDRPTPRKSSDFSRLLTEAENELRVVRHLLRRPGRVPGQLD